MVNKVIEDKKINPEVSKNWKITLTFKELFQQKTDNI